MATRTYQLNPQKSTTYDGKTYTVPNTYGMVTKTPTTVKSSSSTTKSEPSLLDYNDLYNSLYKSAYSGSGGYTPQRANLSDVIETYNKQAENKQKAIETAYANKAADLKTSLERFQQQNALDKEAQQQNYLSNQAALESARLEADRQNRISASSRGLAGSGLQQLSQLQTLLSQGQDISNLATSNQAEVNKLRTALAQQLEDYNTQSQRLSDQEKQEKQDVIDTLASTISGLQYQADVDYANAVNQARAQASANRSAASSYADTVINQLMGAQGAYQSNLTNLNKSGSTSTFLNNNKELVNYLKGSGYSIDNSSTKQEVAKALRDYYLGSVEAPRAATNALQSNLNSILSTYNFK